MFQLAIAVGIVSLCCLPQTLKGQIRPGHGTNIIQQQHVLALIWSKYSPLNTGARWCVSLHVYMWKLWANCTSLRPNPGSVRPSRKTWWWGIKTEWSSSFMQRFKDLGPVSSSEQPPTQRTWPDDLPIYHRYTTSTSRSLYTSLL